MSAEKNIHTTTTAIAMNCTEKIYANEICVRKIFFERNEAKPEFRELIFDLCFVLEIFFNKSLQLRFDLFDTSVNFATQLFLIVNHSTQITIIKLSRFTSLKLIATHKIFIETEKSSLE